MKKLKAAYIIHGFALMHAAITLACRWIGMDDSLILTVMTMLMTVLICFKKGLSVELTAASIILVNVAGFTLGTGGAWLFGKIIHSPLAVHAVSTFVTTEVMGWCIVLFTKFFKTSSDTVSRTSKLKWILSAVFGIIVLRIIIIEMFTRGVFKTEAILDMLASVLTNTSALFVFLCVNIIYIRLVHHRISVSVMWKLLLSTAFVLGFPVLMTLVFWSGFPFIEGRYLTDVEIIMLYVILLLIEITFYSVTYMVDYVVRARTEMHEERSKAHKAEFLYMKLKQQVNPHFLFNSLNILDCLVCEEKTEQASLYIHKLAGIYRYMLRNEDETVVRLKDEMVFVGMYVDLLKVRFTDGFEVEIAISEDVENKFIVPCSVQLLIENAIKHNAVSLKNPLKVRIADEGNSVVVRNNICRRLGAAPSTGVGLKYIKQEYNDLSDREITVTETETEYSVTLPLL